ncbi:hypothetical protein SY88_16800 [Clostridiales bacterium PH28_bin88]|nr:hypothetical protein SY88_16800 [Clostridiales bacterium PH28_bin88]
MSGLPKIGNPRSLSEQAYEVIKDAIITNRLQPNQVLTEEELAAQLGISRTPLRTALNRLAFEKLVEVSPGRGAVVARISLEEIHHLSVIREALEPLAAGLAVPHLTSEQIDGLEEALELQKASIEQGDYMEYLRQDLVFHNRLAFYSQNGPLAEIIENLSVKVQRFLILAQNLTQMAPVALHEHYAVLEALKNRDSDGAARAMKAHVHNACKRMPNEGHGRITG